MMLLPKGWISWMEECNGQNHGMLLDVSVCFLIHLTEALYKPANSKVVRLLGENANPKAAARCMAKMRHLFGRVPSCLPVLLSKSHNCSWQSLFDPQVDREPSTA